MTALEKVVMMEKLMAPEKVLSMVKEGEVVGLDDGSLEGTVEGEVVGLDDGP